MKQRGNQLIFVALLCGALFFWGCSNEKAPEQVQKLADFTLSPSAKEELLAFYKDMASAEGLADKAITVAGNELKNVLKGGSGSLTLASVVDRAKTECLNAGQTLATRDIPKSLPPEAQALLSTGREELIAAYAAHAAAFEAIKSFAAEKNPLTLLEYREKSAQAQQLLSSATGKIKSIMSAAGAPQ